jgi:hypothetical protein
LRLGFFSLRLRFQNSYPYDSLDVACTFRLFGKLQTDLNSGGR